MTSSSEEAVQRTLYGVPTMVSGPRYSHQEPPFLYLKTVNIRC